MAEPGYAEGVPERFGHYTQPADTSGDRVWVHAVSMGEARAAGILLAALREVRTPDVGGTATTAQFTAAVHRHLSWSRWTDEADEEAPRVAEWGV